MKDPIDPLGCAIRRHSPDPLPRSHLESNRQYLDQMQIGAVLLRGGGVARYPPTLGTVYRGRDTGWYWDQSYRRDNWQPRPEHTLR